MATDAVVGTVVRGLIAAALAATVAPAFAAGGGGTPFTFKPATTNVASLQRGARDYMAYCSGCHSLKYLRYSRLGKDLGISEDLLKANLMFTSDKPGDHIVSSMPKSSGDPARPSPSEVWFGRAPPDLSLTARERGADWVYSYLLTFYIDPSKANGTNNLVLPGASMPHVLADLQGWQVAHFVETEHDGVKSKHFEKFELVQPGKLSAGDYKEMVGDLTNFLVYAAEPGRNHRMAVGGWVLLFTAIFGVFCYLLKVEYWKDVH
ncbi:MAG: cytochrome c1 [Gammaproteobacteria bacterium]